MPHTDHDDHGHTSDLPDATVADERDAIYTVLANKHQRAVLACIGWAAGTDQQALDGATVMRADLTDHLTGTFSMSNAQATATLHHSVLPRLEDMGLVTYDSDRATIRVNSASGIASILRVHAAVEDAFDGDDPVAPRE